MILLQSATYARKFLMVLTSDHISGATGKTVTVKLSRGPGDTGHTANGAVTELDSTNCPGVYQISLTGADTATLGDMWYTCSASGCDNTDFVDQVQSQVFTQVPLQASTGRILIADNVQQNTALNGFQFIMTNSTTHTPQTGLTVTAQRSLGGAGFAPCVNSVTEISNGFYTINLAASDLNSATVALHFTATAADDTDILLITTP